MVALQLSSWHAYYGQAHILQGINLSVNEGAVVGLFGRNGAGKTTLLKSIMGLVPRVEGSIYLFEQPLEGLTTDQRARRGLAYMPQETRVFGELTVLENFRVAATAAHQPRSLEEVVAVMPELSALLPRLAGRLSGGQQQLASLARSLATNCRVLLMDEPTEGLMPRMVERIGEVIRKLANGGLQVLLVEQNIALGLAVCDTIYLIEKGRICASGTPAELRASNAFERFLGVGVGDTSGQCVAE